MYISFNVAIEIQKFNINSLHHEFTHSRSIADCITVSSTTVQTFKPSADCITFSSTTVQTFKPSADCITVSSSTVQTFKPSADGITVRSTTVQTFKPSADFITVSSTTFQTFKPSERQSCYVARSNVNRSVEFNMNKTIQNNIM